MHAATAPLRILRPGARRQTGGHVWALRGVTFDVLPGEVLGIVGRNGAGKSTLLKVLSRITEPTTGRVEMYGRVGSLLEVGTGFHPELTGRENILLSGAILGMRRAEIIRKFDEIVDFAEITEFVDTPVKHYSSGMYTRLAFAVAAHLDPEILLVDEVLAVGDLAFQKKCLGKLGDVARGGRTVLFVSHNMAAIEALCSSAILVSAGRIEHKGTAQEIVSAYAHSMAEIGHGRIDLVHHGGRSAGAETVMQNVTVFGDNDAPSVIRTDSLLSIRVEFKSRAPIRPCLGLTVKTDRGFKIFHVSDRFANQLAHVAPMRSGTVICEVPNVSLMPGRYVLDLWLEDFASQTSLDMIADAISFDVIDTDVLGTGRLAPIIEGPVFHRANWRLEGDGAVS